MKQQKNKAKQTGYRRFLTVLFSVCAVILAAGVVLVGVLWSQLSRYDETLPQYPVDEFLGKLQTGDLTSAISLAKVDMAPFEDTNDCLRYIDTLFADGKGYADTSWRKAKTDGDKATYNIYRGEERVMTVTVMPTNKKGVYGRTLYAIESSSFFPVDDITVTVPMNAVVKINGQPTGNNVPVELKVMSEAYKGLGEEFCPTVKTYTVSGLLEYPDITVTDAQGSTYLPFTPKGETPAVNEKTGKSHALTYFPVCSQEQKAEFELLTEKAGKTYAQYITRKASLYTLRSLILRDSTFYKDMGEYDNSWFSYNYNQQFENIEIFDVCVYDDTHFTADLNMKMSMNMATGPRSYDLHYRVAFVKENEQWYVAYLATIGSNEMQEEESSQTASAQ